MKRSDIKVGEAYYYDRSTNWDFGGFGGGVKAVVVDGERYTIRRASAGWGWRRDEEPYSKDPKGTAVLVDLHRSTYNGIEYVERIAVSVVHLRGPYELTKATVEANITARRDADKRAVADHVARQQRAEEAVASAGQVGIKAQRDLSNDLRVTVSTVEFATMVNALAATGWRYNPSSRS